VSEKKLLEIQVINQNNFMQQTPQTSLNTSNIQLYASLFITLAGLIITLIGISFSFDIFKLVFDGLQNPDTLTPLIQKWSVLLQLGEMPVSIDNHSLPANKLLVLIILGLGAFFLIAIALTFVQAGIKILTNSVKSVITQKKKNILNLDYKLNQLKTLAQQGKISQQAYESARDNYTVNKIMGDLID
jgi:hypothetical protein